MKFRFILAAAATAAALMFVSCKQDNPTDDEEIDDEEEVVDQSAIKIDGEFADWAVLEGAASVVLPEGDIAFDALKVFKAYADADYIFFYFEIDRSTLATMDLFIDLDNNKTTGQTANWTEMGAEVLLQASFNSEMKDAGIYNPIVRTYIGTPGGTDWQWMDEAGQNFTTSAIFAKSDEIIQVEMKMIKQMMVLPDLGDTFTIGAIVEDSNWSIIGKLPVEDAGLTVTAVK